MARSPDILPGHGSEFNRFCKESARFHRRHQSPSLEIKPKRKRYFRRVNPGDCFKVNHGEVVIYGCDFAEGVHPKNARKTKPRAKSTV